MILTGLRTGLRIGELRALRWQDVDLVAGRLSVRQAAAKNDVGTPKSGRKRTIELGRDIQGALKKHRHLRGELVFGQPDGRMLTENECSSALPRRQARARRSNTRTRRPQRSSRVGTRPVRLPDLLERNHDRSAHHRHRHRKWHRERRACAS